jgi:hypothetical protein
MAIKIDFVNLISSSWVVMEELLILCNKFENENMRVIIDFMEDMLGSWLGDNILLSKTMTNVIELEQF